MSKAGDFLNWLGESGVTVEQIGSKLGEVCKVAGKRVVLFSSPNKPYATYALVMSGSKALGKLFLNPGSWGVVSSFIFKSQSKKNDFSGNEFEMIDFLSNL